MKIYYFLELNSRMFSRESKSSSAFSANSSQENVYIFLIKSNPQICTLTFPTHFLAHAIHKFYKEMLDRKRTEITFFKITFHAQSCIQENPEFILHHSPLQSPQPHISVRWYHRGKQGKGTSDISAFMESSRTMSIQAEPSFF